MTSRRKLWLGSGTLVAVAGISLAFAQTPEPVGPETLLPERSVLYVGIDGGAEHEEAWQETAAYEAPL